MPVFLTHKKPLILEKSEGTFYSHYHCEVEIKYVVDGTFRVVDDGVAHDLKRGDIWIGFPFIEHSFESDGENDVVVMIFSPENAGQFAKKFYTMKAVHPVINVSELPPGFGSELIRIAQLWMATMFYDRPRDSRIFESNIRAGFSETIVPREVILTYLTAAVGELLSSLELKQNDSTTVYSIQRIVSFCVANMSDPELSMPKLSSAIGLSRSQISRLMSQHMKTSFPEFIHSIRINQSRELLVYTDKTITDIAFECGFMSQRSFNRVFREVVGMTPSEYRASPHGSSPSGILI